MALPARAARVLTVSQLLARVRERLETDVGSVWVAGEISNLKRAPSGHLYFTLKEDGAQIGAVMFRSAAQVLAFRPQDGAQVLAWGRPSIYPERGQLQLYVQTLEPKGLGALQLAFEQLKQRLAAEGLFDAARKRPLPRHPETIGIVTALTGAVIHDIRVVLRQRWPQARVVVRPVQVQGREAAPEIALGIRELGALPGLDVLIVGRGGGSLEDLWAFDEESVARAIVACPVPVVSAVGHEVDVTIADFAADVRAPTPTAAAQLVVPDRRELLRGVAACQEALAGALRRQLRRRAEHVERLARAIGDPRRRLRDRSQRVDELAERLSRALRERARWERQTLATLDRRLQQIGPRTQVARLQQRITAARDGLARGMTRRLERAEDRVGRLAGALNALSPLACLERGYAIVHRDSGDGPIVRDATTLSPGDRVVLRLRAGRARAVIEDERELMAEDGTIPQRFEDALTELEGLVRRLEGGELPLEDALGAFERGIGLVRVLSERLADVETRVETLLRAHGGQLVLRPLPDDGE